MAGVGESVEGGDRGGGWRGQIQWMDNTESVEGDHGYRHRYRQVGRWVGEDITEGG